MRQLEFSIIPRPPFRLDLTAWALRRRPQNAVDVWDGTAYRRVLILGERAVAVSVTQAGSADRARLHVTASGARISAELKPTIHALLERTLGLRHNLDPFYALAAADPRIAPLVERLRGLKPPRFPSVFEAAVNGIACQQLTLVVGLLLLSRLAVRCGHAASIEEPPQYAFPRPADLAGLASADLRALGFSSSKARALLELSAAVRDGALDIERLDSLDNQDAAAQLLRLRGIGRWTAEYVLLRGLGRLDVFPGDDVGARNNLGRLLPRKRLTDYRQIQQAVAAWQPYAGFLYFHLLLDRIQQAGWLAPESGKAPAAT